MGLESALVDRARTIRSMPTGAGRVRGMTQVADVTSAWFGALLMLPQAAATPDASSGRRRSVRTPTIMFDVIDEENQRVVVDAGCRIEIDSERFGRSLWQPSGDPEVLANLHDVLGYQVTVTKVTDHEFSPAVP
jgi:hypothetical protein